MTQAKQDEIQAFLGTTFLFRGLSPEDLQQLGAIAHLLRYDKGEMLFWQGEEGTGFFIVKSGRVKIYQASPEGKEQILHIFGVREHFAEVPAFDGKCFPASAAALEKTEVIFFPRTEFLQLLSTHPPLAISLLSIFARHLRRFAQLVENISLKEVPGRIAAYLLVLSDRTSSEVVELDITKGQLAAILGTIPETLSRGFNKLTQEGLIATEGSSIRLLDRKGLLLRAGKENDIAVISDQ